MCAHRETRARSRVSRLGTLLETHSGWKEVQKEERLELRPAAAERPTFPRSLTTATTATYIQRLLTDKGISRPVFDFILRVYLAIDVADLIK